MEDKIEFGPIVDCDQNVTGYMAYAHMSSESFAKLIMDNYSIEVPFEEVRQDDWEDYSAGPVPEHYDVTYWMIDNWGESGDE